MKYTLDLSGHDYDGRPGIDRFGGLFMSIDDAIAHGKEAAKSGRFVFCPEMLWVRDEEGKTVREEKLNAQDAKHSDAKASAT